MISPTSSVGPVSDLSKTAAARDWSLVVRFNKGDLQAFEELVHLYRAKIFSVVLGILRNSADAEEITQDAFINAFRNLCTFRGDSSFSTWIYRIAVNRAKNRYWYCFRRRHLTHTSLQTPITEDGTAHAELADVVADPVFDPAEATELGEAEDVIATAMEKLHPPHREILRLRGMLDMQYDEIASVLQIDVGTVKSRIARARMRLKQIIEEGKTPNDIE